MALTQDTMYQQVYNIDTTITIHKYVCIYNDDVLISKGDPHTHTIVPGDDYSGEDADTKAICALLWTPEVIAAYQDSHPAIIGD